MKETIEAVSEHPLTSILMFIGLVIILRIIEDIVDNRK